MSGGDDWLSSLASKAGALGSFIGDFALNVVGAGGIVSNNNGDFGKSVNQIKQGVEGVAGNALSWASDKDPSKLWTGPVLQGLHTAGIGKQGDDLDKGVIGLFGTGMNKAGRLATAGALSGVLSGPGHDTYGGLRNSLAWDAAFRTDNPATFGTVLASEPRMKSILTDPGGLAAWNKELDSSWYGNVAAGVAEFALYSAMDPTRGLGKLTRASRAANYVADSAHADRLSTIVNSTLDSGGDLTAKGNVANTGRAFVGKPLDEQSQAGRLFEAERHTDNNVDINSVMNHLDPLYGTGGTPANMALSGMGEMFVDAGKIADIGLQRQVKLNIRLAITGGGDSMKWLADNVPAIAAKGKRLTEAPPAYPRARPYPVPYAAPWAGHCRCADCRRRR